MVVQSNTYTSNTTNSDLWFISDFVIIPCGGMSWYFKMASYGVCHPCCGMSG